MSQGRKTNEDRSHPGSKLQHHIVRTLEKKFVSSGKTTPEADGHLREQQGASSGHLVLRSQVCCAKAVDAMAKAVTNIDVRTIVNER
jgi:hypothetical protein